MMNRDCVRLNIIDTCIKLCQLMSIVYGLSVVMTTSMSLIDYGLNNDCRTISVFHWTTCAQLSSIYDILIFKKWLLQKTVGHEFFFLISYFFF